MSFLLGCGFVVYAVPGAAGATPPASPSDGSSGGGPSRLVYFHLVAATPSDNGSNAGGYAGLSVSGGSLALEWSVSEGSPGQELTMTMQVAGSDGSNHTFTFAPVQVSPLGTAGASDTAALAPGDYKVGLKVVEANSSATTAVFVSDPATAEVTVGSSPPPAPVATGDGLSYSLVPLPAYQREGVPHDYPFTEGGALIVVSGDVLEVTTSFQGSPNTAFTNVVQTADSNITAGTVTTTSTGGGLFKANVTLSPGTYQVGMLLFVSGNSDSPVAVSIPRAVLVTVGTPGAGPASRSSSTESSSERSTSAESTGSSATTTTSTTGPQSNGAVGRLGFVPETASPPPHGYSYGQGGGGYAVAGGSVTFSLTFTGQSPDTRFSVVLSVNGSERTIGNYTTDGRGGGGFEGAADLGTGSFLLGLTIVDLSSFEHPTAVLTSVPSSFTVTAGPATTSTSTSKTTEPLTPNATSRGNAWTFNLVRASVENVPEGYRFASSGTAAVSLDEGNSLFNVELGFRDGNPSTTYTAALVLNGTTFNLGTMTTNRAGGTLLHSSVQASPGTYLLGLVVYDVSDAGQFGASAPVPVLVSSPTTELVVVPPQYGESGAGPAASTSSGSTSQSSASTVTRAATTIAAGTQVQSQIQNAVANLTIPATVQVTPLQSSTTVLDPRFSVSVGQLVGNGLVIAISGENVTGPRVLLINMSKTAPLSLYPALNITLDGSPVAEASSALQVLNPVSTNPPYYVLVATSDSIQLLVSIPHFSLHLVQVEGVIVHSLVTALELDAPLLLGSIAVVTVAFVAAYAARKRYFAVLI